MSIFSRLSDIINSNISALLDKAENPEKMIRMVIQEMEETLVEVRSGMAKVIAEKKTQQRRAKQLHKQAEDWQEKAELAMSKDREDLAKAALVERASVVAATEAIEAELAKLDETLEKLGNEIDQLQSKLNDARARQKTIAMRANATRSRVDVNKQIHNVNVEDAMNKLEYYEKKIDLMEGQVESLNREGTDLHSEFANLARDEKIDRELQEIKNKLKK
ncbi:MAG: phage shock protein PspA [Pseudohongiellaceae bacterium]|nr:phage shock protein PspA [Pseudohongiellaceae bacterium]